MPKLDLPMIDLDVVYSGSSILDEETEAEHGVFIARNVDDDDEDGAIDLDDDEIERNDNDLVRVRLNKFELADLAGQLDDNGTYTLYFNSQKIRVYESRGKIDPVISGITTFVTFNNKDVYVEGVGSSAALKDAELMLKFTREPVAQAETFYQLGTELRASIKFTVYEVDLDVDSDNTSPELKPDRTTEEDEIEHRGPDAANPGQFPGLILARNDRDFDNDGIPDFADGTTKFGDPDPGSNDVFAPLVITVPQIFLDSMPDATISFNYLNSNPDAMTENAGVHTLPPGASHASLRVWLKDGPELRNVQSFADQGDYVPALTEFKLHEFWTRSEHQGNVITLFLEGIHPSTNLADSFTVTIGSEMTGSLEASDEIRLTVINADLLADTNRDNQLTLADETNEDQWQDGANGYGAIVLPNADDDDDNGLPDNWAQMDWNFDGAIDVWHSSVGNAASDVIDGMGDLDDIMRLRIPKLGTTALPDVLMITLEVSKPPNEPANSYFKDVEVARRMRLFRPNATASGDALLEVGNQAVIRPTPPTQQQPDPKFDKTKFEFVKTPSGDAQGSHDLFKGDGIVEFGVEGLEFGAEVDIKLSVRLGQRTVRDDVVRVRVAPFVLLDNTHAVQQAYVVESSGDLATKLAAAVGGAGNIVEDPGSDQWQQDGYEIGYVMAPSLAAAPAGQMHVVLELPRSTRDIGELRNFIREHLLGPNVGVNTRIAGQFETADSAGNIENTPGQTSPGRFFHGEEMSSFQEDFFAAQGVNSTFSVRNEWLNVKHTDEIVSFASDGQHVVVADPESAWALLLWANSVAPNAQMHQGMDPDFTRTVNQVVNNAALWDDNFGPDGVMTPNATKGSLVEALQAVQTLTGATPPESAITPTRQGGSSATLQKGGALVGFFPNNSRREYLIHFKENSSQYRLYFREIGAGAPHAVAFDANGDPTGGWTADGTGTKGQDAVFKTAMAFLLGHWWGGSAAVGDYFTFTADPQARMIEMPVLFTAGTYGMDAYTMDHVNAFVNGTSVVTGKANGPVILLGGQQKDILQDYVHKMFVRAGYGGVMQNTIYFADVVTNYHNANGSVHCGTNAKRAIPGYKWWTFTP